MLGTLRLPAVLTLSFSLCAAFAAGPAASTLPDSATPKGALHVADQTILEGGMDAALKLYHVTSSRDRELARCSAGVDVACGHLEDAVVQKFGRPTADQVIHILGAKVGSDIDAAREKIDGAKAVVQWKGDAEGLHMVRIDGAWKVDVAAEMKDKSDEGVAQYAEFLKHLAVSADRLADQVASGKLATAKALTEACKQEQQKLQPLDK